MFQSEIVPITDAKTHHFFVVWSETFEPAMRDGEGRIMVWLDRQKAVDASHARHGGKALMTIGMGDDKWAMFQRDEKYIIVE